MKRWSRWTFVIEPRQPLGRRTLPELRQNVADFARRTMGCADHVYVTTYADNSLNVTVYAPGMRPLDPRFVKLMTEYWRRWAVAGWGDGTKVDCPVAAPCEEPVKVES